MAYRTLGQCNETSMVAGENGKKKEVYCKKPAVVALYGAGFSRFGWCWEHLGDNTDRARIVSFFKSDEGKAALNDRI